MLVTPRSQRLQLVFSTALSILILIPLALQLQLEDSRSRVAQLDPAGLSYCELDECEIARLGGLEVSSYEVVEHKWATFVEVRFVNHGRLVGERELWLELVNPAGEISEAAKTRLVLSAKGQTQAIFSFRRKPELLETGTLRLGF